MEISPYDIEDFRMEEIPLERSRKITLCFTKVTIEGKMYIADVYLKFQGDVIANNWLEVIEFFSFLDIYIKRGLTVGHENSFFKVLQKDKILSLGCKFVADKYFLSAPETKMMLTVYNEFRSSNSIKDLIPSKTILSCEGSRATIFSSYTEEKDVKNAINEYFKNNRVGKMNYTIFDEETLKFYNLIKYNEKEIEE